MIESKGLTNEQLIEAYYRMPYAVTLEWDECDGQPCIMAYHPEMEGCMATGSTAEEAVVNLNDARRDYVEALIAAGIPVPLPAYRPATRLVSSLAFVGGSAVRAEPLASVTMAAPRPPMQSFMADNRGIVRELTLAGT